MDVKSYYAQAIKDGKLTSAASAQEEDFCEHFADYFYDKLIGGHTLTSAEINKDIVSFIDGLGINTRKNQLTDSQGNPVDAEGRYILEKVEKIDDITDEDFTKPSRNVELPKISDKMDADLGADGKSVIIKKNIFEKNLKNHPELTPDESRHILSATLYGLKPLIGQSQPKSRPNYWIAIESEDGKSITVLEVNTKKDNVEIVGWHKIDADGLKRKTVPSAIRRALTRPQTEASGMTLLLRKALFLRAKVRIILEKSKKKPRNLLSKVLKITLRTR